MSQVNLDILYQDHHLLVINKPVGINADDFERRVHRLDKDTSGILLLAKNDEDLKFFQKQFKERKVKKKYLALVSGNLKNEKGKIETLIGRSPKNRLKQKIYLPFEPAALGKRTAITEYRVLKRFKEYTLVEVEPKTGRHHQIRCHFAYLGHPLAGDKIYGFKNQPVPEGLKRHFLHATYLKIKLPDGTPAKAGTREFQSELPEDLKIVLEKLNEEKERREKIK